jgi:hypothetical protein
MSNKKWFGGAVVLSAILSLALAGSAWAQSKEVVSGTGSSGGYGSGSQKDKKVSPPAKCESSGPVGVCAPGKTATPKAKPATGGTSAPETSK